MNYSNFACRLSAPRVPVAQVLEVAAKAVPKKPRKNPPRRRSLPAAVAGAAMLVMVCWSGAVQAQESPVGPQILPAPGTVVFAEGAKGETIDDELVWIEESEQAPVPLAEHVEALKTQVTQAAQAGQAAPHRLSALTAILLGGGLAVALFRVRVLFQPEAVY